MSLRKALLQQERKYRPGPPPWATVQDGTDVDEEARRRVVNWMAAVVWGHRCAKCVFFHGVNYLDRFLCIRKIHRSLLQTLGGAAILVASKFCERMTFQVEDIAAMAASTPTKVRKMEGLLLNALNFEVACATVWDFLHERLGKDGFLSEAGKICRTAKYLALVSALNYRLQSEFLPSELAKAIVFICKGAPTGTRWSWPAVCLAVWENRAWRQNESWWTVAREARAKAPPFFWNPYITARFMV